MGEGRAFKRDAQDLGRTMRGARSVFGGSQAEDWTEVGETFVTG
jgi:hypothetical protein